MVFVSCANEDIVRPEWPEWPNVSKPEIENAVLRSADGEEMVSAGSTVRFSADVHDEFNDLTSYRLLITMDDAEILNITQPLTGRSAKIEQDVVLPFVPGFQNGRLTVSIQVSNALANSTTELTLEGENSVEVVRPATPDRLFLVDNNGWTVEMDRIEGSAYGFETNAADLATIGTSFKIAERVVGNEPDYSGLVWGYSDDRIAVVSDASAAAIPTPEAGSHTLENISFDVLSFRAEKMLTLNIDVNAAEFFPIGGDYTQLDIQLVDGAQVNFSGLGADLSKVLRPEFFSVLSATKAKFTGPSALYNLKYHTQSGFLYLERPRDVFYPDAMYIVGTGAGFPQEPYSATLAWDFAYPHQWFFFKKTGLTSFEAILYLDGSMGFKFFNGYGWAQEEDTKNKYTVSPATLATRNATGDIIAGSGFQPGVYRISIDKGSEIITFTPLN